ncbi:MAG: hypothetical protein IPL46_02590 [Saprospiraceae bacterium]|nr:hypothetical protein [Saprospiraceae bacterium]
MDNILVYGQTVDPTQTDEIFNDNDTSAETDPSDRIQYKVTISETGNSTDASGGQLNLTTIMLTTLVPGNFKSSTLAIDDTYACKGNVSIDVPSGSGPLSNDFDDNIAGLTVTPVTFTTMQGGSIIININGGFLYTPPAGFTGTDIYLYTINIGNGLGTLTVNEVSVNGTGQILSLNNGTVTASFVELSTTSTAQTSCAVESLGKRQKQSGIYPLCDCNC